MIIPCVLGILDPSLARLAACGSGGRGQGNASRNLHALITRQGRTLPVKLDQIPTPVRLVFKGKVSKHDMQYPILKPSSWLKYSMHVGGEAFLGGHSLDAKDGYTSMLTQFWKNFQMSNPTFHFFERPDYPQVAPFSIPVLVHGDEGRGSGKNPIMCLCIQPLISWKGPSFVNSSGWPDLHSCTLKPETLENPIGNPKPCIDICYNL